MVSERKVSGFTLIELLVVMAIIATLLAIALPRYFTSVDKAEEAALRQNLHIMRDAIDKYYGDIGIYPVSLDALVTKRYLRSIPVDPITGSNSTWIVLPPNELVKGNVYDVKSGASGKAKDGSLYAEW